MTYQVEVVRECTGATGDNTVTLPFPYRFRREVRVTVDGVERAYGTITFVSSSIIRLPDSDASLVGRTVRVFRDTDVSTAAAVFARGGLDFKDLNRNQTQTILALQERQAEGAYLREHIEAAEGPALRAVMVPEGEDRVVIPSASARASRYAAYSASGEPIAADGGVVVSEGLADFSSALAATGASLPIGSTFLRTAGYYSAGDGGGGLYAIRNSAPGHLAVIPLAGGKWAELIQERSVSPLQVGARGNGTSDDWAVLQQLLTSPYDVIDWGGSDLVYRVTKMLEEARPNVSYTGSATLRLDRTGQRICPLLNVAATATGFFCCPTLVFDHNAVGVAAPLLANQPAFALGCCVLLQPERFDFSCRVINSWDNGVGVIRATWTGDGETVPYNLTQFNHLPQGWRIGHVDGHTCGIGVHGGAFGENGQKGAVVNILTAGDGSVGTVNGKNCRNGFIADFGGGAEVNVGLVTMTGTVLDSSFPANGSGIDCYIGSGPCSVASLKSDNAGRHGLVISEDAGPVTINADIHAAGQNGAIITGGQVLGRIRATNCSLQSPGGYDAVLINAHQGDILVNLDVLCDGPALHKHAYSATQSGGYRVKGLVRLVPGSTVTGPYFKTSGEVLVMTAPNDAANAQTMFGNLGLGTDPLPGIAGLTVTDAIAIKSPAGALGVNLYYDGGWKFIGNGYGSMLKANGDGTISFSVTANNTSGPGAAATLIECFRSSPGKAVIPALPDYASDAAAAAGGVIIDQIYRTGNALKVRIS